MKHRMMAWLATGTVVVLGTASAAQAQTLYGNVYQPAVSPYVWLGQRGGIAPGLNYYNLVQPQLQLNAAFGGSPYLAGSGGYGGYGGLGATYGWGGAYTGMGGAYGWGGPWAYGGLGVYPGIPTGAGAFLATGHSAGFVNYGHYYPSLAARSGGFGYSGGYAPSMGGAVGGGMQNLPSGSQTTTSTGSSSSSPSRTR